MSQPEKQPTSQRDMLVALFTSFIGILGSRVTGLLRDITAAAYWGATGVAQAAYNTAFAFPNMLRSILGEGAFANAFVPMLVGHLSNDNEEERTKAWQLANRAITLQAVVLCAVSLIISAIAIMMSCSSLPLKPETRLCWGIIPVLFPFCIFVCIQGALSAVLNTLKAFFLPSIIQCCFNCIQIATVGMLWLLWSNDELIALIVYCLSTLLAGSTQMLLVLVACRRRGYALQFDFTWRHPEVKLLIKNAIPAIVSSCAMQANATIDRFLVLYLGAAAVGALAYSHHLIHLPVGLFGVAMSQICLPAISRAQSRNDHQEISSAMLFAFQVIFFVALPCTALFAAVGTDLIALLFARGAFNETALTECSWALFFYIVGLPSFCAVKIAAQPFLARKDTRTPMKISLLCILLNLGLNLSLMWSLRQGGMALATSLCSWVNLLVLLWLNRKHPGAVVLGKIVKLVVKILPATVVAGICAAAVQKWLGTIGMTATPNANATNLLIVIVECTAAGIGWLIVTLSTNRQMLMGFLRALKRRR